MLFEKLFLVSNFDQINFLFEKDSCTGNYYQIMHKSISLLEFGNLVATILNQRQNMHEREEDADEEKGKLVSSGQMNSLSSKQDVPKVEVNDAFLDEKLGQPFGLDLCNSRNTSNNPHARVEEDSRISMKHFATKRRTAEIMGRGASWWAIFTFSLCLLSLKFSKPLLQPQGPHSLWLAIVGMFSYTFFVSAASVMLVVGARFSQMQITVMLISFLALLLA